MLQILTSEKSFIGYSFHLINVPCQYRALISHRYLEENDQRRIQMESNARGSQGED